MRKDHIKRCRASAFNKVATPSKFYNLKNENHVKKKKKKHEPDVTPTNFNREDQTTLQGNM